MTNLIDLSKKAKISLEKKNIFGEKAQVVLVLDISGSMSTLYRNGTVQELVDRILGIGMNMDDNKSIEVFTFGRVATEMKEANEHNHVGYVAELMKKKDFEGGTNYAPPMRKVLDKFVSKPTTKGFFKKTVVAAEPASLPTFVLFITDGDNFDKPETEAVVREASNQAVFWQFVGIGSEQFRFLQKLDDMEGRFLDNVDFFSVRDLKQVSDEELYDKLLTEFPQWIKDARSKGILK